MKKPAVIILVCTIALALAIGIGVMASSAPVDRAPTASGGGTSQAAADKPTNSSKSQNVSQGIYDTKYACGMCMNKKRQENR
ncbi:MAG: hypothetical protein ACOX41_02000 [Anaerovoracaceae bacterium]|jgi:hypothetical protein